MFGIKFAALHPDFGYLTYPARSFPVAGYSTNRFTADLHITVPSGYKVIAPGLARQEPLGGDKVLYTLRIRSSFLPRQPSDRPGQPNPCHRRRRGLRLLFPRRPEAVANAYGQEAGKVMSYLTSIYGLPPQANMTFVETEEGAANGYAALRA